MYAPGIVYSRPATSSAVRDSSAGERWYYRYPEENKVVDLSARRAAYEPSSYVERKSYDLRSHSARSPALNFERPNWGRNFTTGQGEVSGKHLEDDDDTYDDTTDRDEIVVRENQRADVEVGGSPKLKPKVRQDDHRLDQVRHLRDQLDALSKERNDLQTRLDEMAAARKRQPESRAEVDHLQEQLRAARGEIASLKDQLRRTPPAHADEEVEELQADLSETKEQLRSARSELTELRIQVDSLKKEKAKMEKDFDTELHEAEREIRQLQDARDQLQAQRDQLEDALNQAQADFDELSDQFNMLTVKSAEIEGLPPPKVLPMKQFSPSRPPPSPRPAVQDALASPVKSDLKTGAVRGRGACAPQERPGDLPWAVRVRSTSPGAAAAGRDVHIDLCNQLGMGIRILDNAYDPEDGILEVQAVALGSLAEKAGLRLGDRIEKWNNRVITSRDGFYDAVRRTTPGSGLRLGLMRSGVRKMALISVP
eukprot:GGOE01036210.1.p1 GENE.GGOE01036210.1~~GGOE01036210.1.p1  ORF type:complete len:490 (+),score=127.58 GGOE01036210.1:26-1471(+)